MYAVLLLKPPLHTITDCAVCRAAGAASLLPAASLRLQPQQACSHMPGAHAAAGCVPEAHIRVLTVVSSGKHAPRALHEKQQVEPEARCLLKRQLRMYVQQHNALLCFSAAQPGLTDAANAVMLVS